MERRGGNDVIRMVSCFAAVVAQVLSHAGATADSVELVDRCIEECFFMCLQTGCSHATQRNEHCECACSSSRNDDTTVEATGDAGTGTNIGDEKQGMQWC